MMRIAFSKYVTFIALIAAASTLLAQASSQEVGPKPKPEETEVWEPVPAVVTPGATCTAPPSDAIILFDGKNSDEWVSVRDKSPAKWIVADGVMTVRRRGEASRPNAASRTTSSTSNGKFPTNVTGTGQARGNSGVFLASTGPGDDGYELQVLDSYNNKTYVNGQAGSIYKQGIPLVNANRKPGNGKRTTLSGQRPYSTPTAR